MGASLGNFCRTFAIWPPATSLLKLILVRPAFPGAEPGAFGVRMRRPVGYRRGDLGVALERRTVLGSSSPLGNFCSHLREMRAPRNFPSQANLGTSSFPGAEPGAFGVRMRRPVGYRRGDLGVALERRTVLGSSSPLGNFCSHLRDAGPPQLPSQANLGTSGSGAETGACGVRSGDRRLP